jgi:VWFA-related protein
VRRLNRRESESTALWDGFRAYLRAVAEEPGRHALVVFTDGRDTASTATFAHVRRAFRGSTVTVFSVDFGDARGTAQEIQLRQISEETGGAMMFAYTRGQMDDVQRRIVTELRSQYSLGYVSTDPRRDGRWRDVTIRLVRPEHKDLRIRARDGYYAAK